MSDDPSTPGSTFHTPEQHLPPPRPPRTPNTTSEAAAASLPVTTGKKRPAPEADDVDVGSPSQGMLARLVSGMTPSRWKRSRSSLDGMSGSAIKSVNRSNEGSGERSVGGDGGAASGSGTRLEKLNLEKKFDDPSSSTANINGGNVANLGGMPVQQSLSPGRQLQQQQQPLRAGTQTTEGGQTSAMELPVKKRVRLGVGASSAAGATSGGKKSVSIGGATSFAGSPYQAFANTTNTANAAKSPFAAATPNGGPKFNIGSASKPILRDVRGRTATPAGKLLTQRRVATPGASRGIRGALLTATAKGGLTRTPGGTIAAGRNLSAASLSSVATTRTSNTGAAAMRRIAASRGKQPILGRSTGYRRRPINARSFKPMSRLLTGVYTKSDSNKGQAGDGGRSNNQSVMLTESIVSQILEESRNKLGLSGSQTSELALFGGNAAKSGDSALDQARTFEEEAKAYKAMNKAVPRVRMNRILGSGQTGGRRFQVEGTSTSTASNNFAAPSPASAGMGSTVAMAATTTAPAVPAPALLFGKPAAQPPVTPAKRAVKFQSSSGTPFPAAAKSDREKEDPEPSEKPFVAYTTASLTPRGKSDLKLTPCKPSADLSKEAGEAIERRVKTDEWKREAMGTNYGFDDPQMDTPRKVGGKRRKGTPHPKKSKIAEASKEAAGIATPLLMKKADAVLAGSATTPSGGGAPFSFMPGGAAASSKVDTPMAFKFGKDALGSDKTPKSPSSLKKDKPTPAATNASPAPAPAASGWGNLFKSKPGEWKCDVCMTKNPKEAGKCLACEAPKAGSEDNGAAASSSSSGSGANGEKKGSIGTGGFSFGGATSSSTAPAPAASPSGGGASIGSGGFSFGGAATTPAKSKRTRDDGNGVGGGKDKATIGAGGFTFGGASPSASAPSASGGGASSFGSGGFSFGAGGSGTTSTPANTPAKPKRGRDDDASSKSPTAPSGGGFTFGAAAAPAPATKANSSAGFTFGASASASGDEKKEDSVSAATVTAAASTSGFSFGATEKKKGGGASIPGFSFGAPPPAATPASAKKDESSAAEPSSKKAMFTFGKGTPSLPVPAGNGANTPAPVGASSFSFGSSTPAAPTAGKNDGASASSSKSLFPFGGGTTPAKPAESAPTPAAAAPMFGAPTFQAPAPAATTDNTMNGAPAPSASSGNPAFAFGSAPAAAPKPAEAAPTPAASFGFGASAPATSGSTFQFGAAAGATSTTPATAKPPASGPGFAFGAAAGVSTPAAPSSGFGATPAPAAGGFSFGSASQPPAAAAPTTPGTFAFGGSPTPAPTTGFGATPAPAAGGFGFGNASTQPAAPAAPTPGAAFAFGSSAAAAPNPTPGFAPAATPTPTPGFGGNAGFGATPSAMGGATPGAAAGGGAFSIGTGGPKRTPGGKAPGTRRILKARRPPGTR
eukprot:CAMPEP_0183707980 /NCGR_PEP_ID=MMETSP0737-20130205/4383_1 /TAXON_ID=385413 /ORGANISM="Thalassiosira miniscula, Strain CCMP1093" /LENGTH=1413 /DNA_ID=CAMNT_0025935751 /DNA_START=74 /DNA_END=4315 /DNA_ORIENTATION=-